MKNFKNKSPYEFLDISSEKFREYVFLGKGTIRIDNPLKIAVSKSGHRVFDAAGVSYFIPNEWQHIYWVAKNNQPNFVK